METTNKDIDKEKEDKEKEDELMRQVYQEQMRLYPEIYEREKKRDC